MRPPWPGQKGRGCSLCTCVRPPPAVATGRATALIFEPPNGCGSSPTSLPLRRANWSGSRLPRSCARPCSRRSNSNKPSWSRKRTERAASLRAFSRLRFLRNPARRSPQLLRIRLDGGDEGQRRDPAAVFVGHSQRESRSWCAERGVPDQPAQGLARQCTRTGIVREINGVSADGAVVEVVARHLRERGERHTVS